jgi:hypothetical protein
LASELEDENRELREKLRFKSDGFDWSGHFYIEKKHPDRPLCPKCFSKETIGHLGAEYRSDGAVYRSCTVCGQVTTVGQIPSSIGVAVRWDG